MEDFNINFDSQEESNIIEQIENALESGDLYELTLSEEEFEFALGYYNISLEIEIPLRIAEVAYSKYPFSVDIVVYYAHLLIQNDQSDLAGRIIEDKLTLDNNNGELFFLKARIAAKLGESENARDLADRALYLGVEDESILYLNMAQDSIDSDDFNSALYYFENFEKSNDLTYPIINDIAYCQERVGNLEKSIFYYQQLLDIDPFNDFVWYNVGTIYTKLNDIENSLQAFEFALALNPKNTSAIYNKALLYGNIGEFKSAEDLLIRYLEIEPDNIQVQEALLDIYINSDNLESAKTLIEKTLLKHPNSGYLLSVSTFLYLKEKNYFSALMRLRELDGKRGIDYTLLWEPIIDLYKQTNDSEVLVYLLISLYKSGKNQLFQEYFEQLLKIDSLWLDLFFKLVPKAKKDIFIKNKIADRNYDR